MIHGLPGRTPPESRADRPSIPAWPALAVAATLALLSASCAYYNTFFLARKNFNAAETSVARSQSDKTPPDATSNYETAITQCRKLLQRHPKSRWADDAVYVMGASYYGKGDYDSALIRLNQLVQVYPKSGYRPDALFLTGMTQIRRHNYAEGQAAFEQVLHEYPKFPRRDEIYFTTAGAAASRDDRVAAIKGYDRIVRELPKSRRMEDALRRIGEIYFDEGKFDSASIAFARMLSLARDDHKRADAAVLQAQTLMRLQKAEDALRLVRESIPKEDRSGEGTIPDNPVGRPYDGTSPGDYTNSNVVSSPGDDVPRLRLQEAAALNQLGRTSEALDTFRGILSRYTTSSYAVEAQFQIGYTYETLLDSLEAARAAYEKVAQLPGRSAFKDQAAQRAQAVRSFITLQKQAQKEDAALESRAASALRIAESLLLDRGLTKEASDQYKKLEEDFPKTRSAARACYALAYIRWKKEADSLGAQQEFRDLVVRYPDSPQARSAIKLLASQGADTTGLNAQLQAIVPDTVVAAPPDSSRAALRDSTQVPAPVDSLEEVRATSVRGEGAPPPGMLDSLRQGRLIRPPRIRDPLHPPIPPDPDTKGPTPDRKIP